MRHFQTLGTVSHDAANDTLLISDGSGDPCALTLWFGREGMYLSVAAGYGPLEIALRPRYRDVATSLAQHVDEITVLKDVFNLTRGQQILDVLCDAGGNAAPFSEALPDLD